MFTKPSDDEIEVSIFGNGHGECLAIHVGFGNWVLIDSCYGESTAAFPLHFQYIQNLGFDLSSSIKLIICTHWHDDHIQGIARAFEVAAKAPIFISSALKEDEFLKLMATFQENDIRASFKSGVEELGRIFEIYKKNKRKTNAKEIKWAVHNRVERLNISSGHDVVINILSPSDEEITESLRLFSAMLPKQKETIRVIPTPNRNPSSIVASFNIHSDAVLLGGDKQNSSNSKTGWENVCDQFGLARLQRANVFKVPHHGSSNGENPRIWNEVLNPAPWSLITPFHRSGLPKTKDISRLKNYTDELYCAGPLKATRCSLPSDADKLLYDFDEMNKRIFRVAKKTGQVVLRKKIFSVAPWQVNLVGAAYKM